MQIDLVISRLLQLSLIYMEDLSANLTFMQDHLVTFNLWMVWCNSERESIGLQKFGITLFHASLQLEEEIASVSRQAGVFHATYRRPRQSAYN